MNSAKERERLEKPAEMEEIEVENNNDISVADSDCSDNVEYSPNTDTSSKSERTSSCGAQNLSKMEGHSNNQPSTNNIHNHHIHVPVPKPSFMIMDILSNNTRPSNRGPTIDCLERDSANLLAERCVESHPSSTFSLKRPYSDDDDEDDDIKSDNEEGNLLSFYFSFLLIKTTLYSYL